ncbi:extracellular ribonuclease LE-like [Gastrolobium bilobum]|uniref:extracellular ribonuclease LE-like n=1 Tax=Gastrolobium bilobum TaxID=150636 RepID=UPI002AB0F675|nr:extracellular ribonuclease LE-like [Gastrolobium bilobum]
MESKGSILIKLMLLLQYLSVLCVSQNFDFFFFVQQWPGSACNTQQGCCYPTTGKPPADFAISGLFPSNNDGSYPYNCDTNNPFQQSQISDLLSNLQSNWPSLLCPSSDGSYTWSAAWDIFGTCSESVLNQRYYFAAALHLKEQTNLLQYLAGVVIPNGGSYALDVTKEVIKNSVGYTPFIECNVDSSGNSQLYQIYLCVDISGSYFVDCPVVPKNAVSCGSTFLFPSF